MQTLVPAAQSSLPIRRHSQSPPPRSLAALAPLNLAPVNASSSISRPSTLAALFNLAPLAASSSLAAGCGPTAQELAVRRSRHHRRRIQGGEAEVRETRLLVGGDGISSIGGVGCRRAEGAAAHRRPDLPPRPQVGPFHENTLVDVEAGSTRTAALAIVSPRQASPRKMDPIFACPRRRLPGSVFKIHVKLYIGFSGLATDVKTINPARMGWTWPGKSPHQHLMAGNAAPDPRRGHRPQASICWHVQERSRKKNLACRRAPGRRIPAPSNVFELIGAGHVISCSAWVSEDATRIESAVYPSEHATRGVRKDCWC